MVQSPTVNTGWNGYGKSKQLCFSVEKARKTPLKKDTVNVDNHDQDRIPIARVHFDLDRIRFDSVDRGRTDLCQHESSYKRGRSPRNHVFLWGTCLLERGEKSDKVSGLRRPHGKVIRFASGLLNL